MFSKNGLEHRIRERPCVKAIEQYWHSAFATHLLVYGHGSRIRTLADYRVLAGASAHTAMLLSESIVNMLFLLCLVAVVTYTLRTRETASRICGDYA